MHFIDGSNYSKNNLLPSNYASTSIKDLDDAVLETAMKIDEKDFAPSMKEVKDFWLNDLMFNNQFWYQNEDNMNKAISYLRSEIVLDGPYAIVHPGELSDAEQLKIARIGVLLRLLANADMKGEDDRLIPALETTGVRYGIDIYDGIGYDNEYGHVITEEFLDLLVRNEQERTGQELGFWLERHYAGEIIDGVFVFAIDAAYTVGTPVVYWCLRS